MVFNPDIFLSSDCILFLNKSEINIAMRKLKTTIQEWENDVKW